ncbi:MAG: Uma2 family endonuclease [Firmicutes bacterium]|nr:Uma2 family endonuclease [Bacillota bacterium]
MSIPKEKLEQYYTFEDWMSWDESVRAEIIDGELVMMAPPIQKHQGALGELFGQLWQFLRGKPCKVFPAPFGVRLLDGKDTVLEPDIIVVCDKSKLDGKVCNGAPDLVIEILSPSTARQDRVVKFRLYLQAGVPEYWIVDPDAGHLQACVLENGEYVTRMYDENDAVPVRALEGCEISLREVFGE